MSGAHRPLPCGAARAALLALTFLALGSDPADAQLGRKSWEFFPHVGLFLPGEPDFLEEDYGARFLWGFSATYHYSDYVGVELAFDGGSANASGGTVRSDGADRFRLLSTAGSPNTAPSDVDIDLWQLTGFVNSGALKPVQVFADGGVGLATLEPEDGEGETRVLLSGGAGVRYYMWKNVALRAEAKDFVLLDVERSDYTRILADECPASQTCPSPDTADGAVHNLSIFAGLTFNF